MSYVLYGSGIQGVVGCVDDAGNFVSINAEGPAGNWCRTFAKGQSRGPASQPATPRNLGGNRRMNKAQLNYLNSGGGGCSGGCGCGGSCGGKNYLTSPGRFRRFSEGMARFGMGSRTLQR